MSVITSLFNTAANTILTLVLTATVLLGCGSATDPSSGAAIVVILDLSESAQSGWDADTPRSAAAGALFEFLEATQAPSGTTIEVIAAGIDLSVESLYYQTAPREWTPTPDDPAPRRSWSRLQVAQIAELRIQDLPDASSALFAASWQGARRLQESGARRMRLVLVSDLRDVSPGRWDFTVEVPEATNVESALAAQGAVPDLHGIDVLACGVHTSAAKIVIPSPASYYASPQVRPWSTAHHQRLQAAWEAVTTAGGAESFVITERCPSVPADLAHAMSASLSTPTAR